MRAAAGLSLMFLIEACGCTWTGNPSAGSDLRACAEHWLLFVIDERENQGTP